MMEGFDSARAGAALMKAVIDGMADMAFLDAVPRPLEPVPASGPLGFHAAIDVLRPVSCRIELQSREELLERITDILFEASAPEGPEREDAVLELLNVIAGSFLTAYFGPGTDIKLELPRCMFSSGGDEGDSIARIDFDAEGSPLRVSLSSIRYRY